MSITTAINFRKAWESIVDRLTGGRWEGNSLHTIEDAEAFKAQLHDDRWWDPQPPLFDFDAVTQEFVIPEELIVASVPADAKWYGVATFKPYAGRHRAEELPEANPGYNDKMYALARAHREALWEEENAGLIAEVKDLIAEVKATSKIRALACAVPATFAAKEAVRALRYPYPDVT